MKARVAAAVVLVLIGIWWLRIIHEHGRAAGLRECVESLEPIVAPLRNQP